MNKSRSTQSRRSVNEKNRAASNEAFRSLDVEINHLRSLFRETVNAYGMVLEGEIAQLAKPIQESLGEGNPTMSSGQLEIIQEMTTLIRKLRIRPEKGRRKDLKKMEALVSQLVALAEKWQWTS